MDKQLRGHIIDVCMKSEYNNNNHGIIKFCNPNIYWGFIGISEKNDYDMQIIREIFNEFQEYINIKFIYKDNIENCNEPKIMILVGDIESFAKFVTLPDNITNINGYAEWVATNCVINKSYVFVSNKLNNLEKYVVFREELIQCLGFTGETLNTESVFYKYKDQKQIEYYNKLFDIDIKLLKFIYSNKIRPCMDIHDIDRKLNDKGKSEYTIFLYITFIVICTLIVSK